MIKKEKKDANVSTTSRIPNDDLAKSNALNTSRIPNDDLAKKNISTSKDNKKIEKNKKFSFFKKSNKSKNESNNTSTLKISNENLSKSASSSFDENNIQNENDLFFEKFNKSKKDFKKETKQKKLIAKKQLLNNYKIQGFTKRLEDNSYLVKVYSCLMIALFISVGFSIAIFTVFLPYASHKAYDSSNVADIWQRVSYVQYPYCAMVLIVFSSLIFILLPAPYLYLLATWFVGINDAKRSKYFILTNIYLTLFATIAFVIIFIISMIMFAAINAPVFQLPANPLPTS